MATAPAVAPAKIDPPAAPPVPDPAVPGAPPKPAAPPAAIALDLGAPPPAAPQQVGMWPDDWRDQLGGADAKLIKRLERYASPRDMANALFAAQNRISSGDLRPVLKKDATPEEVTAYRAEIGIPAKPEEYDTALPDGRVWGDEDKPIIGNYLKFAHERNMHPDLVKANLLWYHQDREAQIEALAAQDEEQRVACSEALIADWGADYRKHSQQILGLIDQAPNGVADKIKGARGPDDRALLNDPDVCRWLQNLAFQINPTATIVGHGAENIGVAIDEEIAKWNSQMGDPNSDYHGGRIHDPVLREKNQARYRDLVAARDRQKK